ncbi:hypothetical protein A6R68_22724 [Neotoma lepida]|uniref:Uncharacterized protein n=1 Tax=Neotoma lepida TaxID=56216 RepID=A0A1A6HYI6_NEOLE|nr:hypothetical protein A6R68_22724 [Neotoma lepida]
MAMQSTVKIQASSRILLILLFTLFAVLASTASIFLGTPQPGKDPLPLSFRSSDMCASLTTCLHSLSFLPASYTATYSPPHFLSPQPPLTQSRLQHWLWSIKH